MKYFFDAEFLEGTQKAIFGETKPTIDLISIGMVDENGREFYAISNEFNLKEAWNRWDKKECCNMPQMCGSYIEGHCEGFKREYWIRENVLRPIYDELLKKERYADQNYSSLVRPFSYKSMKTLIEWNGSSRAEIANAICAFIYGDDCGGSGMSAWEMAMKYEINDKTKIPEFYAYYANYDWVAFCWLFGRMNELPKGFPKYCRDLKQILDEKLESRYMTYLPETEGQGEIQSSSNISLEQKLNWVKALPEYPKAENEHNALSDARWDKKLFDFIKSL
jgi:hypothetical protein